MRDLAGLDRMLSLAADQTAEGPRYRFHGHRSPASCAPTPVLVDAPTNQVGEPKVTDGVATLRLYAPIDSWGGPWGVSALEFIEVLDGLDASVTEIRLHINSPGGEIFEALAILNSLRDHDARVVAVIDGIAASCASFIAVAADETIMSPNTQLMIHDASGLCLGTAADMHDTGDVLDQLSDTIASIYAEKAGGEVATWRATMVDEHWYTAAEAVAAGLADHISGQAEEDVDDGASDPAAAFDLKGIGCKYAGRSEAPAPPAPTVPAAVLTEPPGASAPSNDEAPSSLSQRAVVRHRMNALQR